jgi:hypothetical protein
VIDQSLSNFVRAFAGYTMDPILSLGSVVVATTEQVSCPLGDESAILNLKNSVYYGMNPVGSRVWTLLQQPRSISELRDTLLDEYEVSADKCEHELLELLEKMRIEGLVEVRDTATRSV